MLWPLEKILPYPFLVEEIFKFLLAAIILNTSLSFKEKVLGGVFAGLLFSFSETFLYFLDIFRSSASLFFQRLIFTSALHALTLLLLVFLGQKNKKLLFLGVILNIAIHWSYNFLFPCFFVESSVFSRNPTLLVAKFNLIPTICLLYTSDAADE